MASANETTISSIIVHPDNGYMLEKIGGAGSSPSDAALAGAALATMRPRFEGFRDALNQRGLYGDDMTADALYVLDRADAYLKSALNKPAAEDLRIMTQTLRPRLAEMEEAARDIDSEMS
jgi:hypothetical protein